MYPSVKEVQEILLFVQWMSCDQLYACVPSMIMHAIHDIRLCVKYCSTSDLLSSALPSCVWIFRIRCMVPYMTSPDASIMISHLKAGCRFSGFLARIEMTTTGVKTLNCSGTKWFPEEGEGVWLY